MSSESEKKQPKPTPAMSFRLLGDARAAAARARGFVAPGEPMGPLPLLRELVKEADLRDSALVTLLEEICPESSCIHPTDKKRLPDESVAVALRAAGECPLDATGFIRTLLSCKKSRAALAEKISDETLTGLYRLVNERHDPEVALRAHLASHIAGQDASQRIISAALVAGLSSFRDTRRPRGAMVLAGPTGVGKTETAMLISKLLGGPLIRFDCNMLAGDRGDGTPMLWQLFGPGSGYKGMDAPSPFAELETRPDGVILFDEFEKAHPQLGTILLQALDQGEVFDPQRRRIDFRRCFIILTTNAGVKTQHRENLGFGMKAENTAARVTKEALREDLVRLGHKPEFFGRIPTWAVFSPLEGESLDAALAIHVKALRREFVDRGVSLDFEPEAISALTSKIGGRLGLRPALAALRQAISGKLARLSVGENPEETPLTITVGRNGENTPNRIQLDEALAETDAA